MATPNLTPPMVIAFSGNTGANMCMQAPHSGGQSARPHL